MANNVANLGIDAGCTLKIHVSAKEPGGETVWDLTGWTITGKVEVSPGTTEDLTCTVTDAAAGEVTVTVPAAVSAQLTGSTTYEVRATKAAETYRLLGGILVRARSIF